MALDADKPGLNDAIEKAIESAQEVVAESFRSPFARAEVMDDFFVHRSHCFGGSYQVDLLLSRGLIDTGVAITAVAARRPNDLDDTGLSSNLLNVSGEDLTLVDADKGLIRIVDMDLSNYFVRITYTSGLEDDDGSASFYKNVPEWLAKAVRLNTMMELDANPVIPRPTVRDSTGSVQTDTLEKQFRQLLFSRSRYFPGSYKPRNSTVGLL